MSDRKSNDLHKEFELERIILFSDAVFAIAITLLIIEIKFPELPENYKEGFSLLKMFSPTILHFAGFIVSFIVIGFSWVRHLSMFRYLKGYDNRLIILNLLCLFFIVAFPFTAAGITHMRPSFMFPMLLYIGNMMLISVSHFLLARHIFRKKTQLGAVGHEAEKTFIYMVAKVTALGFLSVFIIMTTTAIITDFDFFPFEISSFSFIPMAFVLRKITKKYKPKHSEGLL